MSHLARPTSVDAGAMLPWHNSIKIMVYQENYISFERGGACAQDCAKKLISHVCPGRLLYDSNYFISSAALINVRVYFLSIKNSIKVALIETGLLDQFLG